MTGGRWTVPIIITAGSMGLAMMGCGSGGAKSSDAEVADRDAVAGSPSEAQAEAQAEPEGASTETSAGESTAEPTAEAAAAEAGAGPVIDHTVLDIAGEPVDLAAYRGRALLIVNTASACGYTPQYAALQRVYGKYRDRGLVVLGFPSNDYGGQEPGTNEEISSFVDEKFGVEFPMMDKIHTRGPDIAPLYAALTQATPEGIRGEVKWNFTKFLVNPSGEVVGRFDTPVDPEGPEMVAAIEAALPATPPPALD